MYRMDVSPISLGQVVGVLDNGFGEFCAKVPYFPILFRIRGRHQDFPFKIRFIILVWTKDRTKDSP